MYLAGELLQLMYNTRNVRSFQFRNAKVQHVKYSSYINLEDKSTCNIYPIHSHAVDILQTSLHLFILFTPGTINALFCIIASSPPRN